MSNVVKDMDEPLSPDSQACVGSSLGSSARAARPQNGLVKIKWVKVTSGNRIKTVKVPSCRESA